MRCKIRCVFGESEHCSQCLIYGICIFHSSSNVWLKHDNIRAFHVLFIILALHGLRKIKVVFQSQIVLRIFRIHTFFSYEQSQVLH